MKRRYVLLLVSGLLLAIGAGLASGAERGDVARTAAGATALESPQTFMAMRLLAADGNVAKVKQTTTGTFFFLCRYVGDAGTAEWDIRWDETTLTEPPKCGVADRREVTGAGVPFAYIYSYTDAAFIFVVGRGASVDEMLAAGSANFADAEQRALTCDQEQQTSPEYGVIERDGNLFLISPPIGPLIISRSDLPEWARDQVVVDGAKAVCVSAVDETRATLSATGGGSSNVLLDGRTLVLVGDPTLHGGEITEGSTRIFADGVPVAIIGSMHTCPMVSPGPVPHVGGPIITNGSHTDRTLDRPARKGGERPGNECR